MTKKYETLDAIIKRLQGFREEYGNIPVKCRLPGALRKPSIVGIQISKDETTFGGVKPKAVDIIPRYDPTGLLIEKGGVKTIAHDLAEIFILFREVAQSIVDLKMIIANNTKGRVISNGFGDTPMTTFLASKFNPIYEQAKKIKDLLVSFKGFDTRLREVVKECISEDDYCVSYAHHIDITMSDAEFAKAVTDGVGNKTSVQRMAIYLDIIDKINKEISARRHRIAALEKRIASDKGSNESNNAKLLINKSQHLIETLEKRREYMAHRFTDLKESVLSNIERMDTNLQNAIREGLND